MYVKTANFNGLCHSVSDPSFGPEFANRVEWECGVIANLRVLHFNLVEPALTG